MVKSFGGIYAGRRVLVTGHTGFKGGWLSAWLHSLGAEVSGLSLPPTQGDCFFSLLPKELFARSWECDLRDSSRLAKAVKSSEPEIVFHLAAQPIVGASYRDPVGTTEVNVMGTAHLLEAVRAARSGAAVLVVTSDKCYRNNSSGRAFTEDDPLGGHDVYSASKAAAELVTAAWHASFFAVEDALGPLATARAGNVIGGGDYGEDRIVPDAVRAFEKRVPLVLRRPLATRPWQHVLESVSGYLALGQRLMTSPDKTRLQNFNFGPDPGSERTVRDLVQEWLETWPRAFEVRTETQPAYGEATKLNLDSSRARAELGWGTVWDFQRTVAETARWYRHRHEMRADNNEMYLLTQQQTTDFSTDARFANLGWPL